MSKEQVIQVGTKILTEIATRVIDPSSITNKTNISTIGGSTIMTVAGILLSQPEPNLKLAGGVIFVIGFLIAAYKENKESV